ncbi:MAG TPA: hypothetical protein VMS17_31210 [Gemmataceae bacterium]|nr:hypothetical protein [Gemmataceae bacterium]
MKVVKYLSGAAMALALVLSLASAQSAKADDLDPGDGRWVVQYDVQVDYVAQNGQEAHVGYRFQLWWDNHQVIQKDAAEMEQDYQAMIDAGWTVTNVDGPHFLTSSPF